MDLEGGFRPSWQTKESWWNVLTLAYQSFGVVYGDLSMSPLYVFKSSFSGIVKLSEDDAEVLGITSLIFWTLTSILVIKYCIFVLKADDNGEGGTFALYSLLCRHAKLSPLPNQQDVDEELSTYRVESFSKRAILRPFLEKYPCLHTLLLLLVLLGTCMVIGDGVLTSTISVLSAVSGLRVTTYNLSDSVIVTFSCLILVGLFTLQHFGTCKIAVLFAPIVILWLVCIGAIGLFNICHWNPRILKGLSPFYIYNFFWITKKDGWMSLGGVVLCITGAEAMFADLGHFSQLSIKVAFMCAVYPCLVLAYLGEAAYLSQNHDALGFSFYRSIPTPLFWPVFVVATLASIVASQAIISGTFSIIKQCSSLGFFPRVKIVHTSKTTFGRIYIPEINWILMILCLGITVGFHNTTTIGNAYGLAVVTVMLVTTCLMTIVIIVVWQKTILLALLFLVIFGTIEGVYVSSCLIKIHDGGWVPVVLAIFFMAIMYTWNYGIRKKYEFDVQNKVSLNWLLTSGPGFGIVRVPGIGLVYTDLVSGVPSMFSHFVTNLPALHRIVVFVCVKSVPVPYVPPCERFLVGRIGLKEHRMFRCIVRYGYCDIHKDDYEFENQLVQTIGDFIQEERANSFPSCSLSLDTCIDGKLSLVRSTSSAIRVVGSEDGESNLDSLSILYDEAASWQSPLQLTRQKEARFEIPSSCHLDQGVKDELKELIDAKEAGVAYILGCSHLKARGNSSFMKKFVINVAYNFLKRNCRGSAVALGIPYTCLIEVGMIYYV